MKETTSVRLKHKARKNAPIAYPAEPPAVDPSIEVLFRISNRAAVDTAATKYGDKIVTTQVLYQPALLALARVTFDSPRWNLHQVHDILRVIPYPAMAGIGDWEKSMVTEWDNHSVRSSPEDGCRFMVDGTIDFSRDRFESLQEELICFLITNHSLQFHYNPYTKLCRGIDEPVESFLSRCTEALRDLFGLEMRAQGESYHMRRERLKARLERKVREQNEEGLEELTVFHEKQLAEMRSEMVELQKQKEDGLKQFEEKLQELSAQQETDFLRLNRANVQILRFALVWLPYTEFVIQEEEGRRLELIQSF